VLLSHRPYVHQLPSMPSPKASLSPALAFDSLTGDLVMFGGVGNDATTWTWRAGHWKLRRLKTVPSARFGGSSVWDPGTKQIVMFGGVSESTTMALTDLWAWTGNDWRELDKGRALPVPIISRLTYDSQSGLITLFLTRGHQAPIEVWVWSLNAWQLVNDVGPALTNYAVAFDPNSQAMLVTGPDATGKVQSWRFGDDEWKELQSAMPGFNGEIIVQDDSRGRVMGLAPRPAPQGVPVETQAWAWTGSAWLELGSNATLPKSIDLIQATSGQDRYGVLAVVMVHGTDNGEPGVNEVWAFTGTAWVRGS